MTGATQSSLIGRWMVEDIGGGGVLDGAPPIVEFAPDGTVTASTGLNRIFGRFEIVDGAVQCSALRSTRMAGPPAVMHQEQRLIEALSTSGAIVERPPFVHIGTGDTALRLIQADEPAAAGSDPIVVEVAVLYRERMMLPADAVVTARVSDVSRVDAPATVLAEGAQTDVGAPPYRFELRVDRDAIDDRATLSASARIEAAGQLLFISDTACPVITRGAPTAVEITVVRVPSTDR